MILQWHEVFNSCGKEHVKVYGPCLWIQYCNGQSAFFAPDGHRSMSEKSLVKYMDGKYGLSKGSGDRKATH
jgi:hypothetical protein